MKNEDETKMKIIRRDVLVNILKSYPSQYVDMIDVKNVFKQYGDDWNGDKRGDFSHLHQNSLLQHLEDILKENENHD